MAIPLALDRRQLAAFLGVLLCALGVAAATRRAPADFSALPPGALVRDHEQQPLWAIRVAARAHLIAVDAIGAPALPEGHAYQLWLEGPDGVRSLGLLPVTGRRVIAETPAVIAGLVGGGELIVTLEPARGSAMAGPSGEVLFRAPLRAGITGDAAQDRLRRGCLHVTLAPNNWRCQGRAGISRTLQAPAPSPAGGVEMTGS